MTKKLSVIGRGTAGSLAAAHFFKYTDWEIDWYFDPIITPQAVGEGANIDLPENLFHTIGFFHDDLIQLDGTFKQGIYKIGWGDINKNFLHSFSPPFVSYHFNAHKLQNFILAKLTKEKRINIIKSNVKQNQISSDFIMDCSGRPENYELFEEVKSVPVNSVYVVQCYWEQVKFQHTLTIARPHGWVFGIPLQNRCSIGYLYNNQISTLEDVKEDVVNIFKEYNLEPSDNTNSFSFNNYYRKRNFDERISYNGNASLFLEPLEATTITNMLRINRLSFDIWNENMTVEEANNRYEDNMIHTMLIIALHYFAGSKYETNFWNVAYTKSKPHIEYMIKEKNFIHYVRLAQERLPYEKEYGSWIQPSYSVNLENLNLYDKLYQMEKEILMNN